MSNGDGPTDQNRRIVLVDDHPIPRFGLKTVIDAEPGMEVIGEAERPAGAKRLAAKLRPDLVILALRLAGEFHGIELCRDLKNLPRPPAVLFYTSFNSRDQVASAFLSGADGFLYKGADPAQLLSTVKATCAGRRVWAPDAGGFGQGGRLQHAAEESGLTPREREVLGLMLQRYTNSRIAAELYVELPTVKTHVSNILRKLSLSSRRELFADLGSDDPAAAS